MQIVWNLDITTFGEKHPLYTAKWHGRTQRFFWSSLQQLVGWIVRYRDQPAQTGKVTGIPLNAMAPSTPAAPPAPLLMALLFQSMTAALMKNVFRPLSAKALIAFTAARPPLSSITPTLLHQSWPLFGSREWVMAAAHHMCRALEYSESRQQLWKAFKVHSWGLWWNPVILFVSNFFRMSSGERHLNHGWSASSLRSCQLPRRFCPGHDVTAQMIWGRKDISIAHSSTLGCWVPVHEICVQLLDLLDSHQIENMEVRIGKHWQQKN